MRGGSVGRRNGGDDDKGFALSDALGGIYCFAAAETHGAGALVGFGHLLQTRDFLTGALAGEIDGDELHLILFGGSVEFGLDAGDVVLMGDEQRSLAEGLDEVTEVEEFVLALNVLGGANKCFSHNVLLLWILIVKSL